MVSSPGSIELQVISRILTSNNQQEVDALCSYDSSFYEVYKDQIKFILSHKYDPINNGKAPDVFTFASAFPDIQLVDVSESLEYLEAGIRQAKQLYTIQKMVRKIADLDFKDTPQMIDFISSSLENIQGLSNCNPLDIVHDSNKRKEQILKNSSQVRIPTGFPEIDKAMYGGLSTVEEFLIVLARTNSGKSWITTKFMESAQANGFPCLYYSPEMQAASLATRFDTWRKHFKNSDLFRGRYTDEYNEYIDSLSKEETPAFILEDKDVSSGIVNIPVLENLVKRYKIKLLIIDGLSYVEDYRSSYGDRTHEKYKNISADLFRLSKKYGCAVVVSMQANRDTKDMLDDKGVPMPNLYSIEGSDHPARIATQVFSMRQIFETHTLDIRLEKSRMANNQHPMFSYNWDVNTGKVELATTEETIRDAESHPEDYSADSSKIFKGIVRDDSDILSSSIDDDWEEDVDF